MRQSTNLSHIAEEEASPVRSLTPQKPLRKDSAEKSAQKRRQHSCEKKASPFKKQTQVNVEYVDKEPSEKQRAISILGSSINGTPVRKPRRTRDERKNKKHCYVSNKKENSLNRTASKENPRASMVVTSNGSPLKKMSPVKNLSPIKPVGRTNRVI